MLERLLALTRGPEFDDAGSLTVVSATWSKPDLCRLVLHVESGDRADQATAFVVECAGVRASRIVSGRADDLELTDQHPSLVPFRGPAATLAVRGPVTNAEIVLADLWEAHRALLGDWVPFQAFLNPAFVEMAWPLRELVAAGGVLAVGPRTVLDAYARVLSAHALGASFLLEGPLHRWNDDTGWQPEPTDLRALVFGGSFVVALDFTAGERPVGSRSSVA